MINIKNLSECCGCSVCADICGKNAITMTANDEGFLYPVVDKKLCVDCGMCDKVCPMKNSDEFESKSRDDAYVAQLRNKEDLLNSQSGGAAYALSKAVIEAGGVVYGCGYKGHVIATHYSAETLE
ncbi:MAG: 4Fe-4S dicluster domain-containing protein, partial [Parabacteroides sp.]|nr:4Fe-4S dicluster domain-containing protein [Parabacteroides sp.]